VEHIFENLAGFWLGFRCFTTAQNDPSFRYKKKYEVLNLVLSEENN
jgi:hypothetical protein